MLKSTYRLIRNVLAVVIVVTLVTLLVVVMNKKEGSAAASGCVLSGGAIPAFCDSFSAAGGGGVRSPALLPDWGVSRNFGNSNDGQGFYNAAIPTPLNRCGTTVNVVEPNDVQICNGMLVDAVTDGIGVDNGTVTSLTMYPKQPFDFAGRTGKISFDVSDDSHGNHRAWPELWVSDSPAPDPFTHFSTIQSTPANGFGIRFAGCGVSGAVTGVDSAVVVNNYVSNDSFAGDFPNGSINVQDLACMTQSSGVGNMNHIEVDVSQNVIDVYGTNAGDPGGTPIHLAHITGFSLSFTRGLVWLEDEHYNGNKDGIDQGTHTFSWDNLAFDGPVLPEDLAFDAPDANTPASNGWPNMGYPMPADVTVPDVVIPSGATSAALLFNYSADNAVAPSVSVNGGAAQAVPVHDPLCYDANNFMQCSTKTVELPIPLSEVVAGNNVVQFSGAGVSYVSNVDILLPGSGGGTTTPTASTTTTTTIMPTTTTAQSTTTTTRSTTTTQPTTTTTEPTTSTTRFHRHGLFPFCFGTVCING